MQLELKHRSSMEQIYQNPDDPNLVDKIFSQPDNPQANPFFVSKNFLYFLITF